MSSVYKLKPMFQATLRPTVKWLAKNCITANHVTILALIFSIIGGVALIFMSSSAWPWIQLPFILFIRMALNAIDGMLAREHQQKSNLGAILNELGDILSDIALYLPFALIHETMLWPVITMCFLLVISETTGIIGIQIGANRRYDGPMGKSDRAVMMGLLGCAYGAQFISAHIVMLGIYMTCTLLIVTIYHRARNALKEANSHA